MTSALQEERSLDGLSSVLSYKKFYRFGHNKRCDSETKGDMLLNCTCKFAGTSSSIISHFCHIV
jgi:hypothetical protein